MNKRKHIKPSDLRPGDIVRTTLRTGPKKYWQGPFIVESLFSGGCVWLKAPFAQPKFVETRRLRFELLARGGDDAANSDR